MKCILPLLLPLLLLAGGCSRDDTTRPVVQCPSPSGNLIATLYRTGDGPTGQTTHINIRPKGATLNSSQRSFSFRYGYDAILRWRSESELLISYPKESVITRQERIIFGSSQTFDAGKPLRIAYRPEPSTHGYFITEQRCFSLLQQ